MESSILAEVVWTQNYNPNTEPGKPAKPVSPTIEIISANLISCSSKTTSDVETLDLGKKDEWVNCESGLERNTIWSETATKPMETDGNTHYFEGTT